MKAIGRFTYALCCIITVIIVIFCIPSHAYSEEAPQEIQQEADALPPNDGGTNSVTSAAPGNGDESASTGMVVAVPENNPFTGTLGYRIPLEVPPGRNGIAPNLALTYSSQAKNGLAGVGWTIDLGAIQRDTRYGLDYNASLNNEHVFVASINGGTADLVYNSAWSDATTACYQSKVEGAFSKYCLSGNAWTVTAKDGVKYFYGSAAAARQDDPNNASRIFKWCLDRVEDTNGNFMTITYYKELGEIYPLRIDYTGNVGLGTTNWVEFLLEDRFSTEPIPFMYIPGFEVQTAKRIAEISTYGNSALARRYGFTYDPGTIFSHSLLSIMTTYAADNSYLPPLTFTTYGTTDTFPPVTSQSAALSSPRWMNWVGDFNGDGKADVAVWMYGQTGCKLRVYISKKENDGTFSFAAVDPPACDLYADESGPWFWFGDFNGDGRTDIASRFPGQSGVLLMHFAQVDDQGNFTGFGTTFPAWTATPGSATIEVPTAWVGDFNGDGKADLLAWVIDAGGEQFRMYFANDTATNFDDKGIWVCPRIYSGGPWFSLGDFNGDGRTDVFSVAGGERHLCLANAAGSGFTHLTTAAQIASTDEITPTIWVGDFNGDGKSDIVSWGGGNNLYINFATGTDFAPKIQSGGFALRSPVYTRVGDFNGDGKSDIVTMNVGGASATYNYSTGAGFVTVSRTANLDPKFYVGDFNGDGRTDIVSHGTTTSIVQHYSTFGNPSADLLYSVQNGIGATTTVTYRPSSMYRNTLLPYVIQTVYSTSTNDGNGNTSTAEYLYDGGLYVHGDREFYGFGYVVSRSPTNITNNPYRYTETYFHQREATGVPNRHKGLVSAQLISGTGTGEPEDWPIGALYTYTKNFYGDTGTPVFPHLDTKDDHICDGTTTCRWARTNLAYDTYGNVTGKEAMECFGAIAGLYDTTPATCSSFADKRIEYTTYAANTATWILNRPLVAQVYDGTTKMAETQFAYDGAAIGSSSVVKGNLTAKWEWDNNGESPLTTYTYNAYGNQTSITTPNGNKANPIANTTTMTYDATYTHVTTVTNPLLHIVDTTWDPRFGKPVTKTMPYLQGDSNPPVTTYIYDPFGRPYDIIQPLDSGGSPTTMYRYEDFGTTSQRVVTIVKDGTVDGLWKEVYFDGFGRTIHTRKESIENPIVTTTTYDSTGKAHTQSYPCFAAGGATFACSDNLTPYTAFAYDVLGRVSTSTFSGDPAAVTSYYYDKGETTIVDPMGHVKIESKDLHGRLRTVKEHTGMYPSHSLYATTTYEYDVLNNLVFVQDGLGNQTTIFYNSLSRKIMMCDPDTGHINCWYYGYDPNGNLTAQQDGSRRTTFFAYDELNRATWKGTDTNTVYLYDQCETTVPFCRGRSTMVIDPSGQTIFTYDERGRSKVVIKTIDTVQKMTINFYDSLDRVTYRIGPDGTGLTYTYTAAGNLFQVMDTTPFVMFGQHTALGRPAVVMYRNNFMDVRVYDTKNARLGSQYTLDSQGQTVAYLSYEYDQDGKPTAILDGVDPTHDRHFDYDELHRLTSTESLSFSPQQIGFSYNEIGNMVYNGRMGAYYTYPDPTFPRPHAPLTIGANSFTYDNNGNMTSGMGRTITWTYENKPATINTTAFTYDYSGRRVKKVGAATTLYFDATYECTNSTCSSSVSYIVANGKRIARNVGGSISFYHTDHLGSTSMMSNQSGGTENVCYYYPFGETVSCSNPTTKYKFTGQEEDTETGLYNYGARHYDPAVGLFISPDSIVPDPADPQTLNRYSYCRNNPVMYVDPSGHLFGIDDLTIGVLAYGMLKGAVLGSALGATVSAITGGDIGQGALTGAISGAFFGGVGTVIKAMGDAGIIAVTQQGVAQTTQGAAAMAGMHAAAGAASGAINASITGGDVGVGALTGGISGGIAKYFGNQFLIGKGFATELVGHSLIGGVTGGITASIYCGNFWQGFGQGAWTGGYGYLFNQALSHGTFSENGELVKEEPGARPYGTTDTELWMAGGVFAAAGGVTLFPGAIAAGITWAAEALSVQYLSKPEQINRFVVDGLASYAPGWPTASMGGLAGYTAAEIQKTVSKLNP